MKKTTFDKEVIFNLSDIVYAKHPILNEELIGEIEYISKSKTDKPYLVEFHNDGEDAYFSAEELTKAPLTSQIMILKEKLWNARSDRNLSDAGYECLLYDSNILEDRVLGLIKQYRLGNDISKAIEKCENALGEKEVVDSVLESVYKERDYNY